MFQKKEKYTKPGTEGETGSGIGLSFSDEIIRAHGGAIKVESQIGKGSCFIVEQPFSERIIFVLKEDINQSYSDLFLFNSYLVLNFFQKKILFETLEAIFPNAILIQFDLFLNYPDLKEEFQKREIPFVFVFTIGKI